MSEVLAGCQNGLPDVTCFCLDSGVEPIEAAWPSSETWGNMVSTPGGTVVGTHHHADLSRAVDARRLPGNTFDLFLFGFSFGRLAADR